MLVSSREDRGPVVLEVKRRGRESALECVQRCGGCSLLTQTPSDIQMQSLSAYESGSYWNCDRG